ncbi:TetR/AcrR family transcriptional regulator [Bacillus spizizenii]|jgi:TetR/AcrR family transcriptional regulator, transcriptional repressor for nem operon|uniref:TetR-family regulatory protein n=1 Tax=Bacillus spizizenii (strain DSM 15029 / JCM 12233 / NBRC 101239 / NRRL B-23049 / TU-B-10) TaxID=1052585 RepID=G4NW75_BACS4|nr:TetR/AcrR family transcriptional regulator [Bacillus spizizenii]AEP85415.1 TetR-family regulatory protein [Bacillus spizizenii TU-B-10]KXJ39134.1 TetR family transcriptional regulator [Bacillus spizizenii]MCI4169552.1 TetR/AcrR family transcriptional regulator [Bacillus spizizenii]MEC1434785.1 TetR/AcrR family transcriptional regulator [Bacillus spizizenii]MEC1585042.1 TetR/AcrR family transcriptional regulator [Bacillus spizizenii]
MARIKEFDEKKALRKAMDLFWEQGYEKTSMQDLVDHMGVHRRSIYDTFGDKHTLFMRALSHYVEVMEVRMKNEVKTELTVKQAIRKLFEMAIYPKENQPKGCLAVNAAVELSLIDEEVAKRITEIFINTEALLFDLLKHGQEQGEIPKHYDIRGLSQFIHNSLVGVRVLAKTTNDKQKLENIIDLTLWTLD